jgi:predicted flap endonuclease-1-like 5' DNA nuclease
LLLPLWHRNIVKRRPIMKGILFGILLVVLGVIVGLLIAWVAGALGLGANVLGNLVVGVFLFVGGFFCGFVIEWIIDEAYRKNRELRRQMGGEAVVAKAATIPVQAAGDEAASGALAEFLRQRDERVHELRDQVASMGSQLDHLHSEFDIYRQTHPDDLTVIKGIGPVYQWKLRDAGVHTYKDLASSEPAQLRRMLDVKSWQRVNIESWIEQARDWAEKRDL